MDAPGVEQRRSVQVLRNRMIRESLARAGDDGSVPRIVSHYLTPRDSGPVLGDDGLRARAAEWGLTVDFDATGHGLRLWHEVALAGAEFEALTLRLVGKLDKAGWIYQGWESPVIRPEHGRRKR